MRTPKAVGCAQDEARPSGQTSLSRTPLPLGAYSARGGGIGGRNRREGGRREGVKEGGKEGGRGEKRRGQREGGGVEESRVEGGRNKNKRMRIISCMQLL